MMTPIHCIGYENEELRDKAFSLATRLGLIVDKEANPCLYVGVEKLALKLPPFSLLSSDFTASTWNKRKNEGKKQGIIRACKPAPGIKIIDATAGWGRDAAILASFGADVLMLERHPIMAALLEDALLHREESDRQKMNLLLAETDAYTYLNHLRLEEFPDVIYIDPMHPERNKSALVKKDMQALQQIIGADIDAFELIQLAISRVKQRVVVKWPQKLKPLLPANFSIEGKTIRFDIYNPKYGDATQL